MTPVSFTGGLLDFLYAHYGFLKPGSNTSAIYTTNINWSISQNILGLLSSTNSQLLQDMLVHNYDLHKDNIQHSICCFIECMLTTGQEDMPADLWDLHPQSTKPFKHNQDFKIQWQQQRSGKKDLIYFVSPVNASDNLCCQFTKLVEVKSFLFINGRHFCIFVPHHLIPQSPLKHVQQLTMLVFLPKDYKLGLPDYHHYEQLHRQFCSLPRA